MTLRMGFASLLLGAALTVTACVGAPPVCVESDFAIVCGPDEATVERLAPHIDLLDERVRAELPTATSERVEVWLQQRPQVVHLFPFPDDVAAVRNGLTGRIHARPTGRHLSIELAHELVHARLGPEWDTLPAALEEGLADQLAARTAPGGDRVRADRLGRALAAIGGPQPWLHFHTPDSVEIHRRVGRHRSAAAADGIRPDDVFRDDDALVRPFLGHTARPIWYGVAFVAVGRLLRRHGIDGFRRLVAETADLDPDERADRLRAASGLVDEREWRAAVLEELSITDGRGLAAYLAPELAAITLGHFVEGMDPISALPRVFASRPVLRVGGSRGVEVELLTVPEFRRALDRHGPLSWTSERGFGASRPNED